ncbi:putative TetR family transcriptional regulator [Microlunatus phosphovorus NM-1]|uniref:Putative TetR family transcriptional regulator n=1 Tax=Microlunatus phosphovorus (strain ATCC 700054 / DSM 10555 / JCM 9379 / NBRC 101784 / NCIMB 13414 / VKM Ac-1990 / NM-1) TaxID=1032480 RepID=F5XIJ9_MICPN|nr:TetR/AcrR family transcriptional regulator [Microlunatus phosphovorus]BAK38237.1 putative TetR family transcriptional regulator [Microlunatus phosphovorus NM-1]
MSITPSPMSSFASTGRRERNKQAKLQRIIAAAGELFTEHGVDDVTTQQIADRADIGAGTLFLYAKTKGELLLLVQNAHYADALRRGQAAAQAQTDPLEAVMAVVTPIVECNRSQIDNGRTYLREMVFGDPAEPHHAAALAIVAQTEDALAGIFGRDPRLTAADAATLARVASAVMFLTMAASTSLARGVNEITADIGHQLALLLR